MVFLWFSYGFPIKTSIFLWFSYGLTITWMKLVGLSHREVRPSGSAPLGRGRSLLEIHFEHWDIGPFTAVRSIQGGALQLPSGND